MVGPIDLTQFLIKDKLGYLYVKKNEFNNSFKRRVVTLTNFDFKNVIFKRKKLTSFKKIRLATVILASI